jgi:RNA polymerase sigma-70 factor (ECF subfamily)
MNVPLIVQAVTVSLFCMADIIAEDESSLVKALRAGDSAAYERLVRDYGARLLAVSKRLLSNHEDALEAVQDGFLSAFRSLESFDGRSQFSTWLHRIVVNASLMKLRSKRRHPEQSIDDLLPTFLADGHQAAPAARWGQSGCDNAEKKEIQALVRSKIESLPDSYRIVLVLRDIEELDTDTVAEMLEIAPGAVKVRLHRARQALRTLLDPVFGKPSK